MKFNVENDKQDNQDEEVKEKAQNEEWEISSLEEEYQNKNEDANGQVKDKRAKNQKKNSTEENDNSKEDSKQPEKIKKRDQKQRNKTLENDAEQGNTLFVRNIDYSATEDDLNTFFGDFGEIVMIKLVKSAANPDVHKGSAFIKFKNAESVEELAKISNEYWKTDKAKADKAHMTNLESQIEFKGRRLAMFKAETKTTREENIKQSKVKEDKRNLDYLKLGLVTTKEFVHTGVSQGDMDTRIRLFQEKQKAMKKNPNLFISKTRLHIRNIDKRMNEDNFREFCMSFCQDWKEALSTQEQKEIKNKKMIVQLKLIRNPNNVDEKGKPKTTGMGFLELLNEDLALYLVRNLNNFITNLKREKGLIVDYSIEDHRKLLKRKQKLDSFNVKLKQAKLEKKKKIKEEKTKNISSNIPQVTIDQVSDVETLKKMLEDTTSRGRRSRIRKRIQKLTGEVPTNTQSIAKTYSKPKENGLLSSEEMVSKPQKPVNQQLVIEKNIEKEVKKNIKRKKKLKLKNEEDVDILLKSFEERINKKLKQLEEAGEFVPPPKRQKVTEDDDDDEFNDVEVDEM